MTFAEHAAATAAAGVLGPVTGCGDFAAHDWQERPVATAVDASGNTHITYGCGRCSAQWLSGYGPNGPGTQMVSPPPPL